MLNTLHKLGLKYGTDKADNGYLIIYHIFFNRICKSAKNILEIGIQHGYSLKMWEEYFPNAMIFGVDIDDKSQFNNDRIRTIKGDQANRDFLNSLPASFDIIIDDGGHTMEQQMISFGCLFKKVRPGGFYVIEDLGTSLMPVHTYGGNALNIDTTLSALEQFKSAGEIFSKYLLLEEKEDIERNHQNIDIYGDYESNIGEYNPSNLGGIAGIIQRR